jgi:hypothetical protein
MRGRWGIRHYVTAAAIAALTVLTIYALTVGRTADFNISHDTKDWADFGEYVGGSLGATYGLLAFIGVMLTIKGAEETAIRQLRGYLSVTPSGLGFTLAQPPNVHAQSIRVQIEVKNHGQTDLVSL